MRQRADGRGVAALAPIDAVFDGYGILTDDGIARLRDGELSKD